MLDILAIMAPVFGIILLGYGAGTTGYLSAATGDGIAEFAFKLAIPALLFRTILFAKFEQIAPLGILASFFGSATLVWAASTFATRFVLQRPDADAPAIAMSCVFGNTIMLGLPIGIASFGPEVLAPISVILSIHAPVFLFSATMHSALTDRRKSPSIGPALANVVRQLSRQPIIIAIVCATILRCTVGQLPDPMLVFADMLAKAGVPAALVALGLSLQSFRISGDTATLATMLVLKLLALPACAAALALTVFHLPRVSAEAVILLAALPAGANAYLFSVHSGRAVNSSSGAVALGTALSAITIAVVVAALKWGL